MHDVGRVKDMLASAGKMLQVKTVFCACASGVSAGSFDDPMVATAMCRILSSRMHIIPVLMLCGGGKLLRFECVRVAK